ncbi:NlpC/P60 family protein [Planosporangium thailandense]|uniref:NlpC/P60 family protein n=1 Tax=Planosporangium thailandense TaxID=765197 RepID=A0ABX0Y7W0_9ACTN|nr:NlpC/P60 family protein [Planosporangium thailandense]NJC73520.1 NlpC/P60 family protein [Planosporangium thailandense]
MAIHAPHHRSPRRAARALIAAVAAVAAALATAPPAHADPDPATVDAQINKAWNDLEPLVEQYNKVHSDLQANQAKAEQLQQQLQPLQLEVDLAMARVSNLAVQAYKDGRTSTLNVLLTGSPSTLADQLAMLDAVAHNKRTELSGMVAVRDKYAADKKAVDDLIAQQQRQDADLSAKKARIEAQIADLQKLRQQASPAAATATAPDGDPAVAKPAGCPVESAGGPGDTAALRACSLLGKPYVWAAAGPNGYDCSGLTLTAWAAAGVSLQHYTNWQWNQTKPVSRADLRTGDLIFFFRDRHHVGIYVGGGWMVHAPRPGDVVRMAKLDSAYLPIAGYRRP